ncbi:MAG: zinc ribbon domain-containing protein [Candidatus Nitrosocaldaceae archaeon]
MLYCTNCGEEYAEGQKYCSNCGIYLLSIEHTANKSVNQQVSDDEEVEYYRGTGEIVVKRIEHRGAVRKVGALIFAPATLGISYLVFGRDKTRKSRAEGLLVITNKAIYCAGNDYSFDRILSITKEGRINKSIVITFEKVVGAGGRDPGIGGIGGYTVEIEIKTKDMDRVFMALEQAKLARVKRRPSQ